MQLLPPCMLTCFVTAQACVSGTQCGDECRAGKLLGHRVLVPSGCSSVLFVSRASTRPKELQSSADVSNLVPSLPSWRTFQPGTEDPLAASGSCSGRGSHCTGTSGGGPNFD